MLKHTKIVATIGPACDKEEILADMVKAGMNAARLNFSHGTHESHAEVVKRLRELEKITGEPVAVIQDLRGPKIRVGVLPEKGVEVKPKDMVVFNTAKMSYDGKEIPLDFPGLEKYLKTGERMLIDDGRVEVKVDRIQDTRIFAEVIDGQIIGSNKGLNFPDSQLTDVSALSDKDKDDLRLGVKLGVDYVAVSFISKAQDILDIRFLIKKYEDELEIKNTNPILIIAKIERREAVENLDAILETADGVMIARGDLGLEVPAAEVPLVQKKIIDQARKLAKPAIVATQMLDSMQKNRRPTRAEVSDVANAVIDHADALMLSNETAAGEHPVLVVETMADIIKTTEQSAYDDTGLPPVRKNVAKIDVAITELSRILAEEVKAKIILAASISGETGRLISHVRPQLPILVATNTERVQHQLNLSWGVRPFILPPCHSIEELVERSINYIKTNNLGKKNDLMIVVTGEPVGQAGHVNLVEVREIK